MHVSSNEDRPLPAAAIAALSAGRMIDAIRYVREVDGSGLREAKQRVEAHVQRDPILKVQHQQRQAQMKRRLIQWVLVIDLLLIAAVIWYFFGR